MRAVYDEMMPPSRACAPPRRWLRPTAASRCFGAASVTWLSAARPAPVIARWSFFPLPDANGSRERCANAAGPTVGMSQNIERRTEGHQHDHHISRKPAIRPTKSWPLALRGDLIRPGDPGYDEVRVVYNAMIDKHPAAIARCRDVVDVIPASVSAANMASRSPSEAAVTTQRGSGYGMTPWSSTFPCYAAPRSTQESHRPGRRRMHLGQTSTTRPCGSAWPLRPASWRPPVWAA